MCSKGIKGGSFLFMGKGDQGRFFFVYGQRGSRAVLFCLWANGIKGGQREGQKGSVWLSQECMHFSLEI